ncbi:hypothetical protein OROMI_027791 [Orobanche minor]
MAAIFIFVFKGGDFLHLRFVIIFDSLQTSVVGRIKALEGEISNAHSITTYVVEVRVLESCKGATADRSTLRLISSLHYV